MSETTIGIVFGGLVSLVITLIFHLVASYMARRQAAEQEKLLKAEVARLATLTNTLGRALHSAGLIDARMDSEGNLIGVNHHALLQTTIAVDASLDARVVSAQTRP